MHYLLKQLVLGSVVGLMGFGLIGCGGTEVSPKHAQEVVKHAQMYTQNTMWAEGSGITTLNFSLGRPIPVNSVVVYEDVNKKQVAFTYEGKRYYLRNSPKHSKTNMDQMLERYFATTKVDLSKFTQQEQAAIKAGRIETGMSKEAVLVARGYPPAHATPSLQSDEWKYWKFQKGYAQDTLVVHFKNNKVSEIQD